jgi:hypothetical protein
MLSFLNRLFLSVIFSLLLTFSSSAQQLPLYTEPPKKNSAGINPYNYDNIIYVADRTYIYDYLIIKGNDTLKYAITGKTDSGKIWKYVPAKTIDSTVISYLGIKTLSKIGPIMMDKPDYNQTEIFLYHYNSSLKYLDSELTGIIENEKNIWLHPFRFNALEILQLSPFPYVKLPYIKGQTFEWKLDLGKKWPEFKAFDWKGDLQLRCRYKEEGVEVVKLPIGDVSVIKTSAVGNTSAGKSFLISYFNEKYGFVKLIYNNLDGSRIIMTLKEIK